jgi:hypothetical protein
MTTSLSVFLILAVWTCAKDAAAIGLLSKSS